MKIYQIVSKYLYMIFFHPALTWILEMVLLGVGHVTWKPSTHRINIATAQQTSTIGIILPLVS